MAPRDDLIEAYVGALQARAILVLTLPAGLPAKLSFEPDKSLDQFAALWFGKPAHAELVMARCLADIKSVGAMCPQGWIDLPAIEVRDALINVSGMLGAVWRTEHQLQREAEEAVEEVVARVEASRQNGGLADVNRSYKIYRQTQMRKGEKAVPYSAHLRAFTKSLVVLAAENATLRAPPNQLAVKVKIG